MSLEPHQPACYPQSNCAICAFSVIVLFWCSGVCVMEKKEVNIFLDFTKLLPFFSYHTPKNHQKNYDN